MSTVYLHIGTPKTGTTALQNFLMTNSAVLERHGLYFPDFGFRYRGINCARNGHFLVTTNYHDADGNRILEKERADYESGLLQLKEAAKTHDRILLTDEAIYNAARKSHPDIYSRLKSDLTHAGIGLKIIIYLRRQDLFTRSHWAQKVKIGWRKDFHEYLKSPFMREYPLNYYEYINELANCVGKDALIIRPYERGQFKGEEHIIQSDFLDIFGLKLSDGFTLEKESCNTRLSSDYLELQRIINLFPDMLCPVRNPKIHNIIWEPFFKPDEQAQFLEHYGESNRALAKEYLDRRDGRLFYDEVTEPTGYPIGENGLASDMVRVYGWAITELAEKNDKLEQEIHELKTTLDTLQKNPIFKLMKKFK